MKDDKHLDKRNQHCVEISAIRSFPGVKMHLDSFCTSSGVFVMVAGSLTLHRNYSAHHVELHSGLGTMENSYSSRSSNEPLKFAACAQSLIHLQEPPTTDVFFSFFSTFPFSFSSCSNPSYLVHIISAFDTVITPVASLRLHVFPRTEQNRTWAPGRDA